MSDLLTSAVQPARRPLGVSILAAWICVAATLRMLAVLFIFLGRRVPSFNSPSLLDLVELLVGPTTALAFLYAVGWAVLHLTIGIGLWKLCNWARILAIFLYLAALPVLIWDLIALSQRWPLWPWILISCKLPIFLAIIWYLFRPSVKGVFKTPRDRLSVGTM